jgi:hypothetical protein
VSECVSEWNVGEKSDNKRGSAITVVLPSELCIHRRCMQAIPSNHIPIFLIPWVTLERSNGSLLQCHTKDGNRVSCWWIVICDSDSIQLNNNSIIIGLILCAWCACVCVCVCVCMCCCVLWAIVHEVAADPIHSISDLHASPVLCKQQCILSYLTEAHSSRKRKLNDTDLRRCAYRRLCRRRQLRCERQAIPYYQLVKEKSSASVRCERVDVWWSMCVCVRVCVDSCTWISIGLCASRTDVSNWVAGYECHGYRSWRGQAMPCGPCREHAS